MSYNTCSHLKGDVAVSECFDGTGIEWQKGRKSMNAVASPSWCLHCLVVKKKLMEQHFAFIVVTKPTWLLEVVQFRRREHGNLTRCAQKPVYNAVAVFQSGTLNEIKTWVC